MNQWNQVVQQGILGTGRQTFQPPRLDGVEDLVAQVEVLDGETLFLQTAALLTQYQAAGALPPPLAENATLAACPPDETNTAPANTAALLRRLLGEADLKLMGEWLCHAARRGMHVPHDTLPPLLDLVSKQRQLGEALAPCLGQRGRWLLKLNPAWRMPAAVDLDESDWSTGSPETRLRFLQACREQDASKARELLAAAWVQEAAKDRGNLVAVLRTHLSLEDEPFLESCLSDRSQAVRFAAAQLLGGLHGSKLRQAVLTELAAYFKMQRWWLKQGLQVQLPDAYQSHWANWGVRDGSPVGVRIGQKAGWLVQLLALTPPSALAHHLNFDVRYLLEQIQTTDFADALTDALLEAATHHQDHLFIAAHLRHLPRERFLEQFTRQARSLPEAQREQCLNEYLRAARGKAFPDWTRLAAAALSFVTLSEALTTHLLNHEFPPLLQRSTNDFGIGRMLVEIAYVLAPACYPQAVTLCERASSAERPEYIDRFLQIYEVRHQMEREFQTRTRI